MRVAFSTFLRNFFQLLPQEKQLDQVARRGAGDQLRHRLALGREHRLAVVAVPPPQFQQLIRRGIMFAPNARAQLPLNERAHQRPRRQTRHHRFPQTFQFPIRQTRPGNRIPRRAFQLPRRHRVIHHPEPPRAFRRETAPAQHQLQRGRRANRLYQPHTPAKPGMNPQQHFRQPNPRRLAVGGDAKIACQRQLQSAAEAVSVNQRNARHRQRLQPRKNPVRARQRLGRLFAAFNLRELAHIRPRDKPALLPRTQQHRIRRVALNLFQRGVQFGDHLRRQNILRGARHIQRQPAPPAFTVDAPVIQLRHARARSVCARFFFGALYQHRAALSAADA